MSSSIGQGVSPDWSSSGLSDSGHRGCGWNSIGRGDWGRDPLLSGLLDGVSGSNWGGNPLLSGLLDGNLGGNPLLSRLLDGVSGSHWGGNPLLGGLLDGVSGSGHHVGHRLDGMVDLVNLLLDSALALVNDWRRSGGDLPVVVWPGIGGWDSLDLNIAHDWSGSSSDNGSGGRDAVGSGDWSGHVRHDWGDNSEGWVLGHAVGEVSSNPVRLDDGRVVGWGPDDGGSRDRVGQAGIGCGNSHKSGEEEGLRTKNFLLLLLLRDTRSCSRISEKLPAFSVYYVFRRLKI